MVFGIGEGKIDIVLPKVSYASGEKILGVVKLQLNSPTKAKELRIVLRAQRSERRTSYSRQRAHNSQHMVTLYEFVLKLGEEKTYSTGDFPFEISIPTIQPQVPPAEGIVGTVVGVAQAIGLGPAPIQWSLDVSLNLPMSFDLSKKVQIQVV